MVLTRFLPFKRWSKIGFLTYLIGRELCSFIKLCGGSLMFIRFVRNRQRAGKNGLIFRGAAIFLSAIIGIAAINNVVCKVTGAESMGQYFGDLVLDGASEMTLSLYRFIAGNEYNIGGYMSMLSMDNDSKDVAYNIMELINNHNNLYAYANNEKNHIQLTYYDPSYTKEQFGGTMVVKENGSDVQQVAQNSKGENTTPDESNETDAMGDYVVPVVSQMSEIYSMEELADFDFLMSRLYTVPSRAKVLESELVAEEMLAKDMKMQGDNSKPQILIYHTHSQEGFADSVAGDESTTIVGVGAYLAKLLSEVYGYNVIHCTEYFDMKGGTLDRSKAYTYSGDTIKQILADNPSIEVVLDIHRDGLPEGADKLVANINGKDTAKIMFFNGVSRSSATGDIDYLYNQYKKDNLAFSFQLKLMAMECFPEFTRRNYIDAYQYNLHLRPKSVLVEVGAQNNTLQEALNAMEILADVLHRVLE